MDVTFPGESAEYRAARNDLLTKEIELRREMEAVAEARRELPPGGEVPEDYVFQGEGADGKPMGVRLSELFAPGKDSLAIYSFMFPRDPEDDRPGPVREQETAKLPLAESPLPFVRGPPRPTRWDGRTRRPARELRGDGEGIARPRLRPGSGSAAGADCGCCLRPTTPTTADYLAETPEGAQRPMLNVFHRDGETIRHFWGSELFYGPWDPGQDPRHVGTLEPLWNLFDLTPEGRPNWDEQLNYD